MNIKIIKYDFDNVTTFDLSCMKRSESEYFVRFKWSLKTYGVENSVVTWLY